LKVAEKVVLFGSYAQGAATEDSDKVARVALGLE